MKRREFLTPLVGDPIPDDPPIQRRPDAASPFANITLPSVERTTAGLEPYLGAFGPEQVLHLLRRSVFHGSRADLATYRTKTLTQVVDQLLTPLPPEASSPLIYATATGETVPVGSTWVNDTTTNNSGGRTASLRGWWTALMLNQPVSLREKMVLFWHNHFVTATATVGDPRFSYRYAALLRQHALGNVKDLTRAITLDGAMLRYLNGNRNVKTAPDENYARELQELFTIGKGPQTGPGDYTNYTEQDVQAAARVLTGWRDFRNTDGSVGGTTSEFRLTNHDVTNKTFSYRYNNTVILGSTDGLQELNALLDMIFAQPETARYICRKLYRWFIYYIIDPWTEANIIEPLATTLRANNYNIQPVLRQLLSSAHFFDPVNMACVIKSPLDFVLGLCRQFAVAFPPADVAQQYTMWNYLVNQSSAFQQLLGDPPDVSGWHAYYQEPQYYELWINSDTLPKRTTWSNTMVNPGYSSAGFRIQVDVIAFVKTLSDPANAAAVVNESAQFLFAIPITQSQADFLKGVLLGGQADYVWANEWYTFIADETNTASRNTILGRLRPFFQFMMQMPEYQLM